MTGSMTRVGLLALGVLVVGCSQGSESTSLPPWQWAVTGMKPGSVAAAPTLVVCEPNGQGCAPVAAGVKLTGSKLVRLERGLSELAIDSATRLEVGEGTELLLTDSPRTIELRSGGMALTRDDSAIQAGPLLLKLVDRTVALVGRSSIIARADDLHRAQLFVGQGAAVVVDAAGASQPFHPGEGAVFQTKAPPDLAALFNGQLSRFRQSVLAVTETPPPPQTVTEPRGLGTMTARVPGTTAVVEGVRLLQHKVRAVVRDGVAQTEVEEVFQNDTARVLEGRYVFPLPADATISGLTLYVNDAPVEGELVEKQRAAAIFKSIVDDTVRPRDPALLEWVSGSKFSLKVFPIPAKGSRKVVLRYQQLLSADGPRQTYVYPMSLGAERSTKIDDLSIDVELSDGGRPATAVTPSGYAATVEAGPRSTRVRLRANGAAPDHDFAVSFNRAEPTAAVAVSEAGFVAMRLRAELPPELPAPAFQPKARVLVVDASQSQSAESFAASQQLAKRILQSLEPDERFALLVCDSACDSVPKRGLAPAVGEVLAEALSLVAERKPGGASDLSGALKLAADRAEQGAALQVVYLGDGSASAGELSVARIAQRVRESFERRRVDLRLLGVGASVDAVTLRGLARSLSGSYDEVVSSGALAEQEQALVTGLRQPLLVSPVLEVPPDVSELEPRTLPNLRLGQEFLVVGKRAASAPLQVTLRGRLDGSAYALSRAVSVDSRQGSSPFAARLWAQSRIAELEAAGDASSLKEIIALSKRFRVMSRQTSWLVLESEQMFADFGIPRTRPDALAPSDADSNELARELDQVDLGALPDRGSSPRPADGRAASAPAKKAEAEAPRSASKPAPAPAAPAPASGSGTSGGGLPGSGAVPFEVGPPLEPSRPPGAIAPPPRPKDVAVIRGGDESWTSQGQAALDKLTAELAAAPTSRKRHEALVRGLLMRGRFAQALAAAERFVAADPDLALARELLAYAAVATGDKRRAAAAADAITESAALDLKAQGRAARALEALGDEARACAHWRSMLELAPTSDAAQYEALRCSARTLDDRDASLREARAVAHPGPLLSRLIPLLEAGSPLAFEKSTGAVGQLEASLTCSAGADCPFVIVVTPTGSVFSPWTPALGRSSPTSFAFSGLLTGVYRVVLVGGAPGAQGRVELRVLNARSSLRFVAGRAPTLASIQVTLAPVGAGLR